MWIYLLDNISQLHMHELSGAILLMHSLTKDEFICDYYSQCTYITFSRLSSILYSKLCAM